MQIKGITLIGMPGAGKSTLGKLLAKDLGLDFIDLDEITAQKTSMPLCDYLDKYSEDKLVDLEEKNTLELDLRNKVFSSSGSIIYRKQALKKLKRETVIVYIKVPKEKLKARIKNIDRRAIVGLRKYGFDKLFDLRTPMYEKCADIEIEVTNESEGVIEKRLLKSFT